MCSPVKFYRLCRWQDSLPCGRCAGSSGPSPSPRLGALLATWGTLDSGRRGAGVSDPTGQVGKLASPFNMSTSMADVYNVHLASRNKYVKKKWNKQNFASAKKADVLQIRIWKLSPTSRLQRATFLKRSEINFKLDLFTNVTHLCLQTLEPLVAPCSQRQRTSCWWQSRDSGTAHASANAARRGVVKPN